MPRDLYEQDTMQIKNTMSYIWREHLGHDLPCERSLVCLCVSTISQLYRDWSRLPLTSSEAGVAYSLTQLQCAEGLR